MMDIRDRLKKLASLVRHDEESLSTCEDAIREFDKFMAPGNAGAAAGAVAHSWYRGATFAAPMPPSRTTQVKLEIERIAAAIEAKLDKALRGV